MKNKGIVSSIVLIFFLAFFLILYKEVCWIFNLNINKFNQVIVFLYVCYLHDIYIWGDFQEECTKSVRVVTIVFVCILYILYSTNYPK